MNYVVRNPYGTPTSRSLHSLPEFPLYQQCGNIAIPDSPPNGRPFFSNRPVAVYYGSKSDYAKSESPEIHSSVYGIPPTQKEVTAEITNMGVSAVGSTDFKRQNVNVQSQFGPQIQRTEVEGVDQAFTTTQPHTRSYFIPDLQRACVTPDVINPVDGDNEKLQEPQALQNTKRYKGKFSMLEDLPDRLQNLCGDEDSKQSVTVGHMKIANGLPVSMKPCISNTQPYHPSEGANSDPTITLRPHVRAMPANSSNDASSHLKSQNLENELPKETDVVTEDSRMELQNRSTTPINKVQTCTRGEGSSDEARPLPKISSGETKHFWEGSLLNSRINDETRSNLPDINGEFVGIGQNNNSSQCMVIPVLPIIGPNHLEQVGDDNLKKATEPTELAGERSTMANQEIRRARTPKVLGKESERPADVGKEKPKRPKRVEDTTKASKEAEDKASTIRLMKEDSQHITPAEADAQEASLPTERLEEKAPGDTGNLVRDKNTPRRRELEMKKRNRKVKAKSSTSAKQAKPTEDDSSYAVKERNVEDKAQIAKEDKNESEETLLQPFPRILDASSPANRVRADSRSSFISTSGPNPHCNRKSMTPAFPEPSFRNSRQIESMPSSYTPSRKPANSEAHLRSSLRRVPTTVSRSVSFADSPVSKLSSEVSGESEPTKRQRSAGFSIQDREKDVKVETISEPRSFENPVEHMKHASVKTLPKKRQTKLDIVRDTKMKGRINDPPARSELVSQGAIVLSSDSEKSISSFYSDDDFQVTDARAGPSHRRKTISQRRSSKGMTSSKASAESYPILQPTKVSGVVAKPPNVRSPALAAEAGSQPAKNPSALATATDGPTATLSFDRRSKARKLSNADSASPGDQIDGTTAMFSHSLVKPTSKAIKGRFSIAASIDPQEANPTSRSSPNSRPRAPARYMSRPVSISSESSSNSATANEDSSATSLPKSSEEVNRKLPSEKGRKNTETLCANSQLPEIPSDTSERSSELRRAKANSTEHDAEEQLQQDCRRSMEQSRSQRSSNESRSVSTETPVPTAASRTTGEESSEFGLRPANYRYPSMTELKRGQLAEMKPKNASLNSGTALALDGVNPNMPIKSAKMLMSSISSASSSEDDSSSSDDRDPSDGKDVADVRSRNDARSNPKPSKDLQRVIKGDILRT